MKDKFEIIEVGSSVAVLPENQAKKIKEIMEANKNASSKVSEL